MKPILINRSKNLKNFFKKSQHNFLIGFQNCFFTFFDQFHFNSEICNVNQTCCNYEYHSLRTLSITGEKCTPLRVNALFDCTHSYTVMPVLKQNGEFFPKIYNMFSRKK